ncbi:MAG: ATP-binding protein [Verrucomicrobiota bacterium]
MLKTVTENIGSQKTEPAGSGEIISPSAPPQSWLESGLAMVNLRGELLDADEAFCNWIGQSQASLPGQSFLKLLDHFAGNWSSSPAFLLPEAGPFTRQELKIAAQGERPPQWFFWETARHGETIFVRLKSILPPLSELEEGSYDENISSESARREMFLRLLRAEAQLDSLMHRWPCVIFSQRPDFSLQLVSPNIAELTGVSSEDWLRQKRDFWQLVHEADAPALQQQFKRAAQTGASLTNTYRIRHVITGRVLYILEHRQPTITRNGLLLGYEVVWLDVTRQTIAEKRLSTAAWKETLAVLTLGMAHDFRNMMAGIQSLSEAYLDQIDSTHPFHEGLALIKNSSLQASQLVHSIIHLHLGQAGERNFHNLNEVASALAELVGKILPRRIRVVTELNAKPLPVYADLVVFRQTVINLLLNAADAMPEGGTLTLCTSRHTELPELKNATAAQLRLPCVCLSIADTGGGIKPRHLVSIFDPFFTTKAKGSGLGLYNARLAVEKHQGVISVESREGAGTTFHLWLPEADFSEGMQPENDPDKNLIARKTLLLLGQGGEMLDKTAELLRSNNYHVVVARTPENVPELIHSCEYDFAGIMVLAEPGDRSFHDSLEEVCRQKDHLKIILKLAGCNPDDLDGPLLNKIDLLLNSDISQTDMLGRIKSLFAANS